MYNAVMTYMVDAIGHVRGGRSEPTDDDWGHNASLIELDSRRFGPEAFAGLEGFSHVDVLFLFDRVPLDRSEDGARHPRGRTDWPLTGIFAQRGKNRPNRLGVTACRIVAIEHIRLHVSGLDAIDGTPVLDIKPVMREFLPRDEVRQPPWVAEMMAGYW